MYTHMAMLVTLICIHICIVWYWCLHICILSYSCVYISRWVSSSEVGRDMYTLIKVCVESYWHIMCSIPHRNTPSVPKSHIHICLSSQIHTLRHIDMCRVIVTYHMAYCQMTYDMVYCAPQYTMWAYAPATISRLHKTTGLICKRAL